MNRKFYFLIVFLIVLSTFLPFVSAFSASDLVKPESYISLLNTTKNYASYVVGLKDPSADSTLYRVIGSTSAWRLVRLGLAIGLFLYIASLGLRLWWYIKEEKLTWATISKRNFEEMRGGRWVVWIAGTPWKVLLFGAVFWIISWIPFLNRALLYITLSFFDSFWFSAFVSAVIIGVLPALFDSYRKRRLESKYEKAVTKVAKLAAKED